MHCYFHVVNGDATIKDETGLEVADLDHARDAAIKALVEVRATNPALADEGAGWRLAVTDASGALLFTLPLDAGTGN
jgi:hypothetical protein